MDKSCAVHVIIALIPIVGIVMGSIVVFFYLLWDHKRKTLLIQARLYSRPTFDLLSFSLLTCILLLSVGIALTVVFAVALGLSLGLLFSHYQDAGAILCVHPLLQCCPPVPPEVSAFRVLLLQRYSKSGCSR